MSGPDLTLNCAVSCFGFTELWTRFGIKLALCRVSGSLDCEKYGLGIWGDEESCVHFNLCVPAFPDGLRALRMKCPEGTKFDWKLKVCNHAHKVDC